MRILWVNPSFLDYRVPVYRRLNELCGGDFHIIFSRNRVPERIPVKIKDAIGDNAIVFDGEKVFEIGKDEMANKHIRIPYTSGLYKHIKMVQPDFVIAEGFFQWTPMAVRYCATHNVPLMIAYERTKWTERSCPKWRTLYRKVIDRFVSGYTVNGILTKEYLEDVLHVKHEKIFVGGMSADSHGLADACAAFPQDSRVALRRSIGLAKGQTYLFVGRLVPRKGVRHLLVGWTEHQKKYPDDNLLLLGGGPEEENLKRMAAEASLVNVHFLGALDYGEVYKYYAISDVFVIPTLEDNWSLVVPEAMACGLPVACSIYNGCYPELVRAGENGITFDPLKGNTIVEALELFHNVDIAAYGQRSREIEAMYNSDVVAQNIYEASVKVSAQHKGL